MVMSTHFLNDALGWGFLLWLLGYGLGMVFFTIVPADSIGWFVTPIGIAVTLWILFKKVHGSLRYFAMVGIVWLVLAVVCDYFFLVTPFGLSESYYKPDIYLYYALTLLLPIAVGVYKNRSLNTQS